MKRKHTADELLAKGLLLRHTDIMKRGWSRDKIRELLPMPVYHNGIPLWRLCDVEQVETSISFYLGS